LTAVKIFAVYFLSRLEAAPTIFMFVFYSFFPQEDDFFAGRSIMLKSAFKQRPTYNLQHTTGCGHLTLF
jgi:hypothetical protein